MIIFSFFEIVEFEIDSITEYGFQKDFKRKSENSPVVCIPKPSLKAV